MRILLAAAMVVPLIGSTLAQTQRTAPTAYATLPTVSTAWATTSLTPCRSTLNPTSSCYSGSLYPYYSAVELPTLRAEEPKIFPPGAADLDESEAKSLITKKGYTELSVLKKDSHGIWRGTATLKNGKPVNVVLDLQGNIYSEPQ